MPWEPGVVYATVDQRALIDKVLARYAGQFDLFRELLQNSDDADSSTVEIHFETSVYRNNEEENKDNLADLESKVSHWTIKNDGKKFHDSDWERLRTIALGNPNPRKVGAFGVGFYVVFSKTDSPFVSSGGKAMRFHWRDNQLCADCSIVARDPWTTIELPLREPACVPPLLELMRFLVTSITFMVKLRVVQVSYNGYVIGRIEKSTSTLQGIPTVEKIKEGFMTIQGIQRHSITIQAKIMGIVYIMNGAKGAPTSTTLEPRGQQTLQDYMQEYMSKVVLMMFTANVGTAVPAGLLNELCRCMKKDPPTDFGYSLVYAVDDEYKQVDINEICPHRDMSVFQGFRAAQDGQSFIFIGHATAQNTGIGGHMMSRFIPTVERELIDLGDSATSVWNRELLRVGGLLCRAIYEWELSDIQRLWAGDGTPGPTLVSLRDQLHQRFLRILQFFAYRSSTPSAEVSHLLRASFCEGSSKPFLLLSSHGVLPSSGIKAFDQELAPFLKHMPMLSESVTISGARIIEALPTAHRVLDITPTEVIKYLSEYSLTSEEMVCCLQWWMKLKLKHGDRAPTKAILLNSATLKGTNRSLLHLSFVRYFVDRDGFLAQARIALDGPLPDTLIPDDISKFFTRDSLEELGWKDFTIITWLKYISDPAIMSASPAHDFTKSKDWAEHVLEIIGTLWSSLSDEAQRVIKATLETKCCIPTAECLFPPTGSYLPDANHPLTGNFHLPIVRFNNVAIDTKMTDFLSFIGVQTHTPLELLLEKQVDTGLWSIYDLVHYLVQLSPTVTEQYLPKLKESVIFPNEGTAESPGVRYRADDLYPPIEEFRRFKLPVIDWGQPQWLDESYEAEFMYDLGLRRFPSIQKIIELCSSQGEVGEKAFKYLCINLDTQYSDFRPNDFREQVFIPGEVESEDKASLRKSEEVFLNAEWKKLGFAVVPASYRDMPLDRLGVQQDPPPSMLLSSLPPNEETAFRWLEALSKRISNFTQTQLKALSTLEIVPIGPPGKQKLRPPKKCYLGKPLSYGFYPLLFDFVDDFGPDVTHFLRACEARDGPSITDVADALIADPQLFYALAETDRFLVELRQLAHHHNHFTPTTMNELCCKPTLLGEKRERADGQGQWKYRYELQKPEDIIVADDDCDYQLFSDCIFVAPRDDEVLQGFYESLGCERLSKLVRMQRKHQGLEESLDPDTWTRNEVRELVQQRLPLFLQKCTHGRHNTDWLPHLNVRVWKTLLASKILRIRKHDAITREQDVWAVTEVGESGQVELWLSASAPKDMYQLATCLCRQLFGMAKDKDTFFLESILSADPAVLEGRGFVVEPAVLQVTESVAKKGKKRHHAPELNPPLVGAATQTDSDPSPTILGRSGAGFLESGRTATGILSRSLHAFGGTMSGVLREGVMYWKPRSSNQLITRDDIHNTITTAVAACHTGNGQTRDGSLATIQLQNNYCESERPGEHLKFCRQVAGIEIHLPEGGCRMDLARHESLARFIQIIIPIAKVYGLSNESFRIFCDTAPGRIAFNRDGRPYVNLLHFEKWHDQAVATGDRLQCQFSWFLTLAHEIAHNISRFHNAEHEFWSSEICETYFVTFARDVLFSDSRGPGF